MWSGYKSKFASGDNVKSHPDIDIGLHPLFPEKAAVASSVKHIIMELAMKGTEFLNPGQMSVFGADQLLNAIIKLLQRQYLETLGEDKIVAMMDTLDTEDKMPLMMGKLVYDSSWTTVLSQAEVLMSGYAQSTINEIHIK